MKLRKRLRRIPEAGLVIFAKHAIPLLSRRAVVALAHFLGGAAYRFSPKLRRIAAANIDIAFGASKSAAEKEQINRLSFNNFSILLLDLFWFGKHTEARLDKYLKFDESFMDVFRHPSAILVSGHYGNWEVMAIGCGCKGYPLAFIAMPIKNRFADRVLNEIRQKTGCELVSRSGALRAVMKALKGGKGTALGIDQNTLPEEGGVFVPFFGLDVPVSNATGVLCSCADSKIFVSWCVPDAKGCYTAYAKKPIDPGSGDMSREEVTACITREFEDVIRKNPEFWLWSYKRWRFYRESDDCSKFPFYSKSYEGYARYLSLVRKYESAKAAADDALQAVRDEEAATEVRGKTLGEKWEKAERLKS